ncbi:MAG: DUF420 domain-containing protein [Oligoflexia bacterium]|nr:DUF420 domain-containing protein [Oligoflexia bacterium]
MFPPGFLGTRADLLLDLVIVSLAGVVPAVLYSWRSARTGSYVRHRNLQLALIAVLTLVLGIFEMNLRAKGGIDSLTRESRFAGTWILDAALFVHLAFAFSSAALWVGLTGLSLWKFQRPPRPGAFSSAHRFWGRLAMLDLLLTGASAIVLYVIGFVF